MMLYPPMASLVDKVGSRYLLVNLVARRIPPALADKVVPGVRVVVPFGGGNRRTEGIVLSLGTAQSGMRLKALPRCWTRRPCSPRR